MKIFIKPYTFFALIASMLIVAACQTSPTGTTQTQTPAQIAAEICPSVQVAVTSLQALNGLPTDAQTDLTKVSPIVSAVCSPSAQSTLINVPAACASVTYACLQAVNTDVIPILISVTKASPLSATDQNKVILDISAAQIILTAVEAAQAAQAGGMAK